MVEKPDYVLNFVRPVNTEIKYIRGIGIYMSGVMFMIHNSEGQEKSPGKYLEA